MRHRLSAVLVSALALLAGNGLTEARTAPRPEGRWSTAALSRPRSNPVAVAVGHQVLFAGGVVGDTGSPLEADVYDAAGQWTTSTLPRVRGSLWVGGGLVAAPLGPVALVVGPADLTNPSTPLAADRYDGTTGV